MTSPNVPASPATIAPPTPGSPTVPAVTRVDPPSGSDAGGDVITIGGFYLGKASSVVFGTQAALAFKCTDDNTISAQSPPAVGQNLLVHVKVTTPDGTSSESGASWFAYIAASSAWKTIHTVGLAVIVVAIVLLGSLIPLVMTASQFVTARPLSWIAVLVLVLLFVIIAGEGITDRWDGVFIDDRNKISLSRLQVVLWTILIVSALSTVALANVVYGVSNPLQIGIPAQIWTVLGISTVSLVGSPLILSSKAGQNPQLTEAATTTTNVAKQDNVPVAGVINNGAVVVKTDPKYARWSDLFRGEETGNADYLDMAKIQMFFFTIILVFAYAVALFGSLVAGPLNLHDFPALDSSMVALLGISHGAYLTSKVTPHSTQASSV